MTTVARLVVPNGKAPERTLVTGAGSVEGAGAPSERQTRRYRFTSAILPK